MEVEVATMASGSSSELQLQMHCVTCGIHRYWTPRVWECDVCRDYLLCESCYKGSGGNYQELSAPPRFHCGDHPMSAHVAIASCDGCGFDPIGNLRWHCKVCPDIDLCEVCYGGLDAADMPRGHLKEHPMINVEVMHLDVLQLQMHCVTCGIHRSWTPRVWECDVCWDYLLCESCYKGSPDDFEVLLAPLGFHFHCQDHPMLAHVQSSICDGCESDPIWNHRWHCKVCPDIDLCEVCYGGLDATDMPTPHLKKHPMIDVEVIHLDMSLKPCSSFSKPTDPQWSYKVSEWVKKKPLASGFEWMAKKPLASGFEWVKKKPLVKVLAAGLTSVVKEDSSLRTLLQANEDNNNHNSHLEEQSNHNYRSSFGQHASRTRPIQQKHKIFLSHAGPQKDFVEQLNLDLSRVHHFGVFFDKDDYSLPKGEPFPTKIFEAAEHCELAIVVISDDYFRWKWPMLELAAFVKAQKERPELKILPLFYKLSVKEFKQPKRQQSFIRDWKKLLGSSRKEGEIQEWIESLEVISRTNGLEYDRGMGEVMFRREIVEAVCKQVKPNLGWDDSHVQGKLRLHKMIYENIQSSSKACTSTLFMGLYGMGGCGKTTMCKVIGNQVMEQYFGQVCHIEFGSMDILQLLKKLLLCICSLEPSLIMMIDEGQALKLLKHHISLKKICMMIDNVLDDHASIEEARTLLDLPFLKGSLILVTSRSRLTLEKLNTEWEALVKIPSLTMDEAKALFMYHTGCYDTSNLLENHKKVIKKFIDRCNFKVEDMVSREYHPLALKVLGTRAGRNPEEWVNVDIDSKDHENESKHHIFSILRLSYDTLTSQYKGMFLDIALSRRNYFEGIRYNGMRWQIRCLYDQKDEQFTSNVLKVLQSKSLIEFYDAKSQRIYIHDLYREFVLMEVEKSKVKHSTCCVFSRASNGDPFVQERRLRIYNHPSSHITKDILSCTVCSRVELFFIQGCPNLECVDVPEMRNLKMFEIYGGCPKLKSINLEGAMNLQCLNWVGFEGEYPDLTSLESLEGLWLVNDEAQSSVNPHGCLDFLKNSNLEELYLTYLPHDLLNLNQAVLLKHLYLLNCQHLERFEGLEALVQLEDIKLKDCLSLLEFPSLANFPSLIWFMLEGAAKLKVIHGFAIITALEMLSLSGGEELKELPGIEACTKLSMLDLFGTSITDCSWLSTMKDLTYIDLSKTNIRVVPDCSALCKLSDLWLSDCQFLESVGDNRGSINPKFPKSLQRVSVWDCQRLNAVPQFPYESALEFLDLSGTSVDNVSSVLNCQQLQKLDCGEMRITSLPDLSSLTRLKMLAVDGCELLTRMDNTKSLPALEELYASGCTSLIALPDLGSSTELKVVTFRGCPMINPNLVKLPRGSTIGMETEDVVANQRETNDDADLCEREIVLDVTNSQEPELAHNLWRCARLLNLVALVGSLCGGLGEDATNVD